MSRPQIGGGWAYCGRKKKWYAKVFFKDGKLHLGYYPNSAEADFAWQTAEHVLTGKPEPTSKDPSSHRYQEIKRAVTARIQKYLPN